MFRSISATSNIGIAYFQRPEVGKMVSQILSLTIFKHIQVVKIFKYSKFLNLNIQNIQNENISEVGEVCKMDSQGRKVIVCDNGTG